MLITLTPSHHWARITHILLAVQLLPLSAILLSHHQILGLAFLPIGVSTVVSSALLRLRARGEDDLHSAARALLDAVVAAGLVIVLTLTVVLSWWAGEVGLLEVYTGFLVIISLTLHTFLAVQGWYSSRREDGYVPVPKADKADKI